MFCSFLMTCIVLHKVGQLVASVSVCDSLNHLCHIRGSSSKLSFLMPHSTGQKEAPKVVFDT